MVSRPKRDLFRRKQRRARERLDEALGAARDEDFIRLCWATWSAQLGGKDAARRIAWFPEEAFTSDLASPYRVSPWELETLVNELLTVPKDPRRGLRCDTFDAMALAVNRLRRLHDYEDGLSIDSSTILQSMHRLGQQQFAWQRGFNNLPHTYRNWFCYSGPHARSYFHEARGYSFNDFTCVCFGARALFEANEWVAADVDTRQLAIPPETSRKIIEDISAEVSSARELAKGLRRGAEHVAYAKSVLRQYPCIRFGRRLRAPLPDLVLERATSGLFYDLVAAPSSVRREIGERFEIYCRDLLASAVPGMNVIPPMRYGPAKASKETPDALITLDGEIQVVAELKATWMSFEARFSPEPTADARRGYEEIAKGVVQIWKFISDCRLGRLSFHLPGAPIGLVLTRDTWLQFADPLVREVFDMARELAANDVELREEDQIPVVFCPISDMETILRDCSPRSFLEVMQAAISPQYSGWMLERIHNRICADRASRHYPFRDRVHEVVSWWRVKAPASAAAGS